MTDPVFQVILERRSVRQYTGASIPREKLDDLVRAGMAAPTSKDTRHLRFLIVDDMAVIGQMLEGLPYAKMLATARHAIVVLSDLEVAYGGAEIDYWVQDAAAATENILLAAKSLGLGTCWTGVHPRQERVSFLRTLFGLPDNVRPLCVIAVGVGSGYEHPRDKYNPLNVFWNKWGSHN